MKILIFGGSGMLGGHVMRVAMERGHDRIFAPSHSECSISRVDDVNNAVLMAGENIDVIINCAGAVRGHKPDMILTNGIGPHVLAATGIRLIHMSTDCVFSGRSPNGWPLPLEIGSPAEPLDIYGRSKLLGELNGENVLVVRGSFIDPAGGFLWWLLHARGAVDAWASAYWNGTSARRMAEQLVKLAESKNTGIVHVAAPTEERLSKAWMVEYFADALDLRLNINITREPKTWRILEPTIETISVREMCAELVAGINGVPQ